MSMVDVDWANIPAAVNPGIMRTSVGPIARCPDIINPRTGGNSFNAGCWGRWYHDHGWLSIDNG